MGDAHDTPVAMATLVSEGSPPEPTLASLFPLKEVRGGKFLRVLRGVLATEQR